MSPILILCIMPSQLVAVWVLLAPAWKLPLPAGAFPVTGRWLRRMVLGFLVLTMIGPALVEIVDLALRSPPAEPASYYMAPLFWAVVDICWLLISLALVVAASIGLDLARRR